MVGPATRRSRYSALRPELTAFIEASIWNLEMPSKEEIELASKTSGEIAGHVADVLVEKSGVLDPAKAVAYALTNAIDAFFYPPLVSLCQLSASIIERKRLPRVAIEKLPPRLLRGILEGGAMEHDEEMRKRWVNLLANAVTEGGASVRAAFPRILADLEPTDAALLDELFVRAIRTTPPTVDVDQSTARQRTSLDNLVRLELLRYVGVVGHDEGGDARVADVPHLGNGVRNQSARSSVVALTAFGAEFLQACREPPDPD